MYEVSSFDHLSAKVDALYKKIDSLTITPPAPVAAVAPNCEICGTPGHTPTECHLLVATDQANYAHGNPYGQRNPNFPYKNNNPTYAQNSAPIAPPGFQGQRGAPVAPQKSNLELMMENFVMSQSQQNKEFLNQNIHTNEMIKQLASKVDTLATHNKMLETQIAQVAQQ